MDIRCVHRDIHSYPLVPVEIRHGGKKRVKAVRSRLVHPQFFGTDWPVFNKLVG